MSRVSITGSLGQNPELKFTNSGMAVVNFSIAESYKPKNDREEETYWWNIVAWNQLAEHAANSLRKGSRVVIEGRLTQRSWKTQDDQKRTTVEIVADSVGVDLRFGTAEFVKSAPRDSGGNARPVSGKDGTNDEDYF